MSGWPFKYSTGEPKDIGLYLACWILKHDGEENCHFALVQYDLGWDIGDYPDPPDYWMEVTDPRDDLDQMKEYENSVL